MHTQIQTHTHTHTKTTLSTPTDTHTHTHTKTTLSTPTHLYQSLSSVHLIKQTQRAVRGRVNELPLRMWGASNLASSQNIWVHGGQTQAILFCCCCCCCCRLEPVLEGRWYPPSNYCRQTHNYDFLNSPMGKVANNENNQKSHRIALSLTGLWPMFNSTHSTQ